MKHANKEKKNKHQITHHELAGVEENKTIRMCESERIEFYIYFIKWKAHLKRRNRLLKVKRSRIQLFAHVIYGFKWVFFTHRRCSFSAASNEVAVLHNKQIPCVFRLVHCNWYCIESFSLSSIGIRPNGPVTFHILHCIPATCISNICRNSVGFSLLIYGSGCECPPKRLMLLAHRLEYLAVSHIDCSPNRSVRWWFLARKSTVFHAELSHRP